MAVKPTVYIASAYTKGDPAINTHFQCKIFDQLLSDGIVLPIAPLHLHFQQTIFPRPQTDWIEYDLQIIRLYDYCLRLDARVGEYEQAESSGADGEVEQFIRQGKMIFYSIEDLYTHLGND